MIKLAVLLGRGPLVPPEFPVDKRGVGFAFELRLIAALALKVMPVLEEQDPRRLLNKVKLVGDHVFDSQGSLNAAEYVLVNGCPWLRTAGAVRERAVPKLPRIQEDAWNQSRHLGSIFIDLATVRKGEP